RERDAARRLAPGQALEQELLMSRCAHEVRQRVRERMLTVQRGVPVRADNQDAAVWQVARQEFQKGERGPIGLVKVIQDEDERSAARRRSEKRAHAVEEAESRLG